MLQMKGNEMFSEFGTVWRQGRFCSVDGLAKALPRKGQMELIPSDGNGLDEERDEKISSRTVQGVHD
jgi:hypothetical protein